MLDIQTGGDSCASGNSGERGGGVKKTTPSVGRGSEFFWNNPKFILYKVASIASSGPEIFIPCFIFFHFFSGVTQSLWANPLKRELCPVAALFVWLLITGL